MPASQSELLEAPQEHQLLPPPTMKSPSEAIEVGVRNGAITAHAGEVLAKFEDRPEVIAAVLERATDLGPPPSH